MEEVLQIAEQEQPQQQDQAMVPQDQVNKLIAREKFKRREVEERYQREIEQLNATKQQQQQRNENVSREVDANALYQQFKERLNADQEAQRKVIEDQQLKEHMTQIADSYYSKKDSAKSSYADYDEVVQDFDENEFPKLVYMLSGMENAGHILYDLSQNPTKIGEINNLIEHSPKLARKVLLKLSSSITNNKNAMAEAGQQTTADPLDRLQTSKGATDTGKMNVKDLRNQSWLRG